MSRTLTVQDLFLQHQEEMLVAFRGDRKNIDHPTSKGDAAEIGWIEMLETHLPHRYSVAKAFILDHAGTMSDQIDVVIFDQHYTPLLRAGRGALYIPAEGVYAVFEVRQQLSKSNIEYAASKAASVRALQRTSATISHAGGKYPPKKPHHIVAGLLTFKSSWSPPFGDSFVEAVTAGTADRRLDLGCSLQDGAWRVLPERAARPEVSAPESALISFFLDLLGELQQTATVPAIDFSAYDRALPSR